MTAELADYETAGCGYCLHRWHDDQSCEGERLRWLRTVPPPAGWIIELCDCPSSERP